MKAEILLIMAILIISVMVMAEEGYLKYGARPWLYEVGETVYYNESHLNKSQYWNKSGDYVNTDNSVRIQGLIITYNETGDFWCLGTGC